MPAELPRTIDIAGLAREYRGMRRIQVATSRDPAIRVTRTATGVGKLVYLIVTDKPLRYVGGRSRVAYIGTTKNGVSRMAASAAYRASAVLGVRGVDGFDVHVISCAGRQNVKTWRVLERALLLTFRATYGEVPLCNTHGKNISERDEFSYFTWAAMEKVLARFSRDS